jgi:hypothetical protein
MSARRTERVRLHFELVLITNVGGRRFDMLVWKTRIPPYVSYVATCDMERARHVVRDEKRGGKRLRDQQDNHASNESI